MLVLQGWNSSFGQFKLGWLFFFGWLVGVVVKDGRIIKENDWILVESVMIGAGKKTVERLWFDRWNLCAATNSSKLTATSSTQDGISEWGLPTNSVCVCVHPTNRQQDGCQIAARYDRWQYRIWNTSTRHWCGSGGGYITCCEIQFFLSRLLSRVVQESWLSVTDYSCYFDFPDVIWRNQRESCVYLSVCLCRVGCMCVCVCVYERKREENG